MSDWVQKQMDRIRKEQADASGTEVSEKGGPGSGHHGHAGRPGKRGGSAPGKGGGGGRPQSPRWAESKVVPGTGLMRNRTLAAIAGDLRKASKYGWMAHPQEAQAWEDVEKALKYGAGDRADYLLQRFKPPDGPGTDLHSGLDRSGRPSGKHLPVTALLRDRTLARIVADLQKAEDKGWIANDKELLALGDAREALTARVGADNVDRWVRGAHKIGGIFKDAT